MKFINIQRKIYIDRSFLFKSINIYEKTEVNEIEIKSRLEKVGFQSVKLSIHFFRKSNSNFQKILK